MKKKIAAILLAFIVTCAAGVWYYVFVYSKKHHRNVENEAAITVAASQIVKDYQANENSANAKYLNKAVEVKGVVLSEQPDVAGNTTLTLKSGDAFSNIFCTLKPGILLSAADSVVVVKGICSGFLSDVVLKEAIIINGRKKGR